MGNNAIVVEGLSKAYRMRSGTLPAGSPLQRLASYLRSSFRKTPSGDRVRDDDPDLFWALRDVSFEVPHGGALGIIGKNGSGKSTLLKILSGITPPTRGRAEIVGRVGSLLEVGTGFHPDLTGRSNIYMAGGLLGMPRSHIDKMFDQIVEFSGLEAFIDVPVKRYSSGMYVRLAYAVASQLETDILILDEVLAVGDAEFIERSKRNIDKIVNSDGRTILFVSHSMAAVADMCDTGMVLEYGRRTFFGSSDEAVSQYMKAIHGLAQGIGDFDEADAFVDLRDAPGWDRNKPRAVVITSIETLNEHGFPTRKYVTGEPMRIRIGFEVSRERRPYFTIFFIAPTGERCMTLYSDHCSGYLELNGKGYVECLIPELRLASGDYSLTLDFGRVEESHTYIDSIPNATQVRIKLADYLGGIGLVSNQGWIAQQSFWNTRGSSEVEEERGAALIQHLADDATEKKGQPGGLR